MNTVFITGTDTGVGKTVISAAIASFLKDKGVKVGYFKPVETGCSGICEDGKILSQITGQKYEEVVLYRFKNPVAPYVAEKYEGKKISFENIKEKIHEMKSKYQFLIVEGAGGIMVPITEEKGKIYTYLDLVSQTGLKTLIVSRASLGTINHTVLTVKALKSINADIKGIVLNGFSKNPDLSEKTNPYVIEKMTGLKVIVKCKKSENPVEECKNHITGILH